MKFTKKELAFLDFYAMCTDTKNAKADKVNIRAEKDKVYFSQYSTDIKFITTFPNNTGEVFDVTYSTNTLNQRIKMCGDDENIEITESNITFGGSSGYQYETHVFEYTSPEEYLNIYKQEHEKEYNIVDVNNLKKIKSFVGNEEAINTISLQNNSFISYNETILAILPTKNKIEDILFFPAIMLNIFQYLNMDKLSIKKLQGGQFYGVEFGDTILFVEINTYDIPNVFSDDIKKMYEHPYTVTVDKEVLKSKLQMIKTITAFNSESRVYFNFGTDVLTLESRDSNKGQEPMSAEIQDELKNSYLILNTNLLLSVLNSLSGEKIIFYSSQDDDLTAIKISDEKGEDFFVHVIYEDLQVVE